MVSPNTRQRLAVVGGALLVTAAVSNCSTDKSSKTTPIKFVIEADELVNPNARGKPSPVVVRIYELKSTANFTQAQFFELFDDDAKRLGPDLVAKREVELTPGDKVDFERNTPIETQNVGVIAGFRSGNDAQWRSAAEIKPDRDNRIWVKLTAQAVSIEKEESRNWWKIF
ncbi:type VI secretion system lipoprotein TssJ (plasmid) [Bradyrhizobium barranii subsp. apii]|uniref:Type VI secretion system lipoprotein TssJ n=1 Tax=Bradyrhizobium septentrionale TaxID=1404411 RepID=A0A973WAC9_9BRAD|nr:MULTISPECIES: type VI secretion system lipoprotein TssJ [Bradyrhizobium]UGY11726.1 type VI secretion system lipoprotein TssJ [Bradyrhizobium septentrionale]UGY29941.1 type VI secretion system lipoprotein TssJ [Bradyrhizobium septentrionale]UPU01380.1 type VI secretion system lipoprotein TssJ [Bradyrhizobium barranii subsp. apii]